MNMRTLRSVVTAACVAAAMCGMSGIAAYMRGEDGRLISIRISDYAWMEKEIDWQKAGITEEEAKRINAVREFPAGVGRKQQETL